jgi:hypothetical protein
MGWQAHIRSEVVDARSIACSKRSMFGVDAVGGGLKFVSLFYPGVGGGGGNAVNRMVGSGLKVRMRYDILQARPHILQPTEDSDIIVF